ncbi:MAG: type IX secretion system membrane protein PorP/SprF, partial [Chitinophagales bacterium]|nr:type IX secretion system membrane protein PorP/SprF [Chitinophagales bacterium]
LSMFAAAVADAQQVEEFSLVRENAFLLNPALAGMEGWIHGVGAFRRQFTRLEEAPYTAAFAMDGRITNKRLGLGGYLLHDQTGPTGKSGVTFACAYHFHLWKIRGARYTNRQSDHVISVGLALGAVQYRLRGDKLQLNNPGDPGLAQATATQIFPDASAGIYYRYKQNFYIGISSPQILGLNVNFRSALGAAEIRRVQHLNVLVGGKIAWYRGNFSIDPVAAFRWAKGAPPQGDIGLRWVVYRVFWIGANYRSMQQMIFEGGFNAKDNFRISYAYDFNFSPYRQRIGATHEIALSFTVNKSSRIYRGVGPVLRF